MEWEGNLICVWLIEIASLIKLNILQIQHSISIVGFEKKLFASLIKLNSPPRQT